jgi:hypothetical protein
MAERKKKEVKIQTPEEKKRNNILAVLFVGVLMGALDIAIVGPALPAIKEAFQVNDRLLAWMVTIYILFNLVGTMLMAKLSDIFGRRIVYVADVAIFAVGSLIVSLSPGFTVILIGRAIQGFGAGGIFPVASAVIGDTFPPEKRGQALGLIGAVFGIAFIIGPILGSLLLPADCCGNYFLQPAPASSRAQSGGHPLRLARDAGPGIGTGCPGPEHQPAGYQEPFHQPDGSHRAALIPGGSCPAGGVYCHRTSRRQPGCPPGPLSAAADGPDLYSGRRGRPG